LSFLIKLTLLIVGVSSALYYARTVSAAAGVGAGTYSTRARFVAVATIVLWVAIMFLGRWIAYDVEIWQSWHLA
jgi:hypothetical protein